MIKRKVLGVVRLILLSGIVGLTACGGSGGSDSGGGATAAAGNKVVRGNVSSVGDGIGFQENAQQDQQLVKLLEALVTASHAGDIQGIQVCIGSVCTTTDGTGAFVLDLVGISGGIYPITFSINEQSFTAEVEVMDDALVILENVTISDDGVVRINNVRVVLIDDPVNDSVDDPINDPVDDMVDSPAVQKVRICHKPGTPAEKTLFLPESALKGHLGHGDVLGDCPA